MTCPTCQTEMTCKQHYRVKGLRYNNLPGIIRVYWCATCRQKIRCCEVHEARLREWGEMWEAARQEWIHEKAQLEQKIYWLKQPTDYAEQKLQALRSKLIHLIESTL